RSDFSPLGDGVWPCGCVPAASRHGRSDGENLLPAASRRRGGRRGAQRQATGS
ncbi:unnamed protein product, partial [Lampetra fluviatilis]